MGKQVNLVSTSNTHSEDRSQIKSETGTDNYRETSVAPNDFDVHTAEHELDVIIDLLEESLEERGSADRRQVTTIHLKNERRSSIPRRKTDKGSST